jgi:hypothetical protein
MQSVGSRSFMGGKLRGTSMAFWDWHGFISNTYSNLYPFKALFDVEYDQMFVDLYSAQELETI